MGVDCLKYMGSKRWMLGNSLGTMLDDEVAAGKRFVDLFAGSAAVSWFVAQRHEIPVVAVDLQRYSKVLAEAVLLRTGPAATKPLIADWLEAAEARVEGSQLRQGASRFDRDGGPLVKDVLESRIHCASTKGGTVWRNYGGHYFSPTQALAIDTLRHCLPHDRADRSLALAALMTAAIRCAASPGHLAQPLQPSVDTKPYLKLYWNRDVFEATRKALDELAPKHALAKGKGVVSEATKYAQNLGAGDVVFLDPPYSSVQYSRFYHVLETITTGTMSAAAGRGRYPPESERPASHFSMASKSQRAMALLLKRLARRKCKVLVTFPDHDASNGLSGQWISRKAGELFRVDEHPVKMKHSTLGGHPDGRPPVKELTEIIITLKPR